MSRSVTAWPRWVSLAECSCSSFDLILLCAGLFLPSLQVMSMTTVSGKSRLLSVGFRTGARRKHRVAEGGLHL
jgi:hypothetical protein